MARLDTYPHDKGIIVSLRWGTRAVSLRFNRWLGFAVLGVTPGLAAWFVVATVYLVDHDPQLGALMARQTSMQYSYEDRIAALESRLERETGGGASDRQASGSTLDDLAELGVRLERHARVLDMLAAASASKTIPASARPVPTLRPAPALPSDASGSLSAAPRSAVAPGRPALRLEGTNETNDAPDGLVRDGDQQRRMSMLNATFVALESRQLLSIVSLREPVLRHIARLREALAQAGLPTSPRSPNAGGPFVPLSPGAFAPSFDEQASLLEAAIMQRDTLRQTVDQVPLRRPIEGSLEVTSPFGARLDPFLGRPAMHTGIDLLDGVGDKVAATAAGIVTVAGAEGGYGNMVEIDHGNGLSTRYAHLASIDVALHQTVAAGALVGRVGSTGRATGPHLHYETRINGIPVDPSRFLNASFSLFPAD